jgi:hypothetical protein
MNTSAPAKTKQPTRVMKPPECHNKTTAGGVQAGSALHEAALL